MRELELDPKAAAELIRVDVMSRPGVSAETRHVSDFAKKVCEQLGIEADANNVVVVVKALQKAGVKPHMAQEYPKMLTDAKGKPVYDEHGVLVVFNDANDEAAYNAALQPIEAPVDHQNEHPADEATTGKHKKK